MPRERRRDAPGLWHHVMFRGVGGALIFHDDDDRERLLGELDRVLPAAGARCTAWALMPNHGHLKLARRDVPLGTLMHRALGAYATWFNHRHGRHGHLFQDRFLSKPIVEDAHFQHLDAYISAQQLGAGIVADVSALGTYRWNGFGAVLGAAPPRAFHDVEEALRHIAASPDLARSRLTRLTQLAAGTPASVDLVGRSVELFAAAAPEAQGRAAAGPSRATPPPEPRGCRPMLEICLAAVTTATGVAPDVLVSGTRRSFVPEVRALIAHVAVDRLGMTATAVALHMNVTVQAISRAARRGRALWRSPNEAHVQRARDALRDMLDGVSATAA